MKQESLQPIRDREAYSDLVAKKLEYELYSQIYLPVLEAFGLSFSQRAIRRDNSKERHNSKSFVAEAVLQGRIAYMKGYFMGNMSAAISKELQKYGARFDKKLKAWEVNPTLLPVEVVMAIGTAREKNRAKIEKAFAILTKVEKEIGIRF